MGTENYVDYNPAVTKAQNWLHDLAQFYDPALRLDKNRSIGNPLTTIDGSIEVILESLQSQDLAFWLSILPDLVTCSDSLNTVLSEDVYKKSDLPSKNEQRIIFQIISQIADSALPQISDQPRVNVNFFRLVHNLLSQEVGDKSDDLFNMVENQWEPLFQYFQSTHDYNALKCLIYMWPFIPPYKGDGIKQLVDTYIRKYPTSTYDLISDIPVIELRRELVRNLFSGGYYEKFPEECIDAWTKSNTRRSPTQMFNYHFGAAQFYRDTNPGVDRDVFNILAERDRVLDFGNYPRFLLERQAHLPLPEKYILYFSARYSHNNSLNQPGKFYLINQLNRSVPVRMIEAGSTDELLSIPLLQLAIEQDQLPSGVIFDAHGNNENMQLDLFNLMSVDHIRSDGEISAFFQKLLARCQVGFLWSCNTGTEIENRMPIASALSEFGPTMIAPVGIVEHVYKLDAVMEGLNDMRELVDFKIEVDKGSLLARFRNGKRL